MLWRECEMARDWSLRCPGTEIREKSLGFSAVVVDWPFVSPAFCERLWGNINVRIAASQKLLESNQPELQRVKVSGLES